MDASVFVRKLNETEYAALDVKQFAVLPRTDEYFSADHGGKNAHFLVVAVNHIEGGKQPPEIYAVQTEPPWKSKKGRAIGFGS